MKFRRLSHVLLFCVCAAGNVSAEVGNAKVFFPVGNNIKMDYYVKVGVNSNCSFLSKLKKKIVRHEGYSTKVYLCPKGKLTVGAGINLESKFGRVNAKKDFPVGKNINEVILTQWFDEEVEKSIATAKKLFPNFNSLPENTQLVLCDLSFNLGEAKLKQFEKFISAIHSRNFPRAAKELIDSNYYKQVGDRGKENVKLVKNS